ncbi:MAG: 16S rRNA (cytosine(1402)-N(4))-methyltransferase [Planctomycetes bacterium RIFCSPHIGHO2_02_FULL_50_42]|nr:MAG: 16S rRNA (cytosine(1402)-N(4))-methyltransferase [Planctomycetes bacterium RIFCSPHIGHO2_02_FULL_50_42]OHB91727.1 MAG: 16S rRNA (cytosine(1402)-N(4))-methyltransferase [Planctomycetes bacterium RIFCSPHIGHO2_12_FULL_51_37]OHB95317.1 MAG: 16S rRNA (cytosine(1402)-N(4))-methyltransferase [Planctomycetes bacterium RIFCSPLOWO2_02_FULL_50_16]OHC03393.1 MAG: 16S rRNA (cytosine(1402)-N(4))-methyltransferase [Planctomycetes bacterium RIFCSPLOWO2_12_FULL_50_35]
MQQEVPPHQPVMLKEVLEWLRPRPGQVVLDCTVGVGGHATAILKELVPGGVLIGVDKDGEALDMAKRFLAPYVDNVRLFHADYRDAESVLKEAGVEGGKVDGILLDLGASSLQLDSSERGFSFRQEGPLDMRMDRSGGVTAASLLEKLSEKELADIFWTFGEERWSRRIARAIKRESPIETTAQLAGLIERTVPGRRGRIHPATRVLQALRIAVNRELESLETFLDKSYGFQRTGGRTVAISFQSLEDRIVKHAFLRGSHAGTYRILTKKPVRPSQEEIQRNIRSRSAKLRAVERL